MNFTSIFQLSTLILLEICGTMIKADGPAACTTNPTNAAKVNIVVYINGETSDDVLWYSRYCSWKEEGMPFSTYAPVTIKVGGDVTCDQNNQCNCANKESYTVDCTLTFQHVCAEQILGQEKFQSLLCDCAVRHTGPNTMERKGFTVCVNEQPGLADQISTCMAKQGSESPQALALKNSKEVDDAGVNKANLAEPFFFYNGIIDKCISDDSPGWFMQQLCPMLKYDIAVNIKQCKEAMNW